MPGKKNTNFLCHLSHTYVGHKIDGEGLHPLPDKVKAIQEAPPPTTIQELRA